MSEAGTIEAADWLASEAARVEASLERVVERWAGSLTAPLADAMSHGLLSGGKRIRPVLCVAAYEACGGDGPTERVHDLAASLEMIHAYSLMHDDLPCMDDAELRRGQPTTHRVHGVEATTAAGAALIPLAARQALAAARSLGVSDDGARALTRVLLQAAGSGGMVGGQALDLLGEGRRLAAAELNELHGLKTGALLAAAPRMGGIAAGADDARLEALSDYGRAIGLAFQIADDVLDATATADQLGKNPSDADLDKSTYVALFGIDEARRLGHAQVERAVEALRGGGIDAPRLEGLARFIMARRR